MYISCCYDLTIVRLLTHMHNTNPCEPLKRGPDYKESFAFFEYVYVLCCYDRIIVRPILHMRFSVAHPCETLKQVFNYKE